MKNCSELGRAEKETWIPPILDRPHAWQVFPYIKIFPFQLKFCLTVTTDKFCFHSSAKYNQFTNFESCHKTGLLSCKTALFKHFTHHSKPSNFLPFVHSALTFELSSCMGSTSWCGFSVSKRSGTHSADLSF